MINYETILSLFDDKLTLLEYLTKIEQALKNEKLTDITVTQTDASHVYFTFVFEDGSTIDTPTFTLPQGEQGEQGIQGVSVTNAEIDASGHLIITLSNGNTIDAGATGLQTVTAGDIDSEEASEYYVLKADGDSGATWGRVTAGDIADNSQVGQYLGSTGYGFAGWKKFEVSGGQINSYAATQGQVLTADGNGGAGWEDQQGGGDVEGTSVKSTGETSGKVLTADGSGGAIWENAGGGGSTLYRHSIYFRNGTGTSYFACEIINKESTAYTKNTFGQYMVDNFNNIEIIAHGLYVNNQIISILGTNSTAINAYYFISGQNRGLIGFGLTGASEFNDSVSTV